MFGKPVVRRRAQGHCGPAMANGSDRLEGDQRRAIIRAAALATPQLAVLIRDTDGLDSARR